VEVTGALTDSPCRHTEDGLNEVAAGAPLPHWHPPILYIPSQEFFRRKCQWQLELLAEFRHFRAFTKKHIRWTQLRNDLIYRVSFLTRLKGPFPSLQPGRILSLQLDQNLEGRSVCKWLGNTPNIAHKHYLTVTETRFQDAAENRGLARDKQGMQPPVTPHTRKPLPLTKCGETLLLRKLRTC